ncbi:hypothetical protein [Bacteroides sp. UBA939]|uniref:hypothetical protein n=1 Tax=Bacteroides sp. UBA939 TaxID=1946092 RepID=UPI0025BE8B0F|nr:hypothetical protein [Bacteroides sp. UBA939]
MKTLNNVKLLLLCVLAIGLMSCDDDQSHIESVIVGRAWTGDIGMNADNDEPLFSTFRFDKDGFGEEHQYYFSDGDFYKRFRFQWMWENGYDNNLILDYGREGISYMDNVRVIGDELKGTFYLTDDSRGYDFVLEME